MAESKISQFNNTCIKHNPRPTQFRDRIYLVLESGQLKIQFSTTNLSFHGSSKTFSFLHKPEIGLNLNLVSLTNRNQKRQFWEAFSFPPWPS